MNFITVAAYAIRASRAVMPAIEPAIQKTSPATMPNAVAMPAAREWRRLVWDTMRKSGPGLSTAKRPTKKTVRNREL